ncbi:Rrf2 family transcriptional regulator [Pseudovibrio sp. SPO723]|uniref:Rrf2 family transcriptional regulator n=1 Tax=Nesiotobacter zosterae TaxID=392721 RepID=UPI0029C33BDF|nr:Rrf2 family transcriptional regulator [Pseudovibrio sp. SPO723]MDX5592873.1 Rrf2 family transcriptional regulator [Pseudovibrio sp. SPO723]
MRLTTRTNLAMRALMFCAVNEGRIVRKSEMAKACNASENHLAQVVNTLSQTGYLQTVRGRNGGIRLAKAKDHISVGAVFRKFEAHLPLTECFDRDHNTCPLANSCRLPTYLVGALGAFYSYLDGISLADLVNDNVELSTILSVAAPIVSQLEKAETPSVT